MFIVYNADRNGIADNNFIMKHFGISPAAAAERVEGMFAHQNFCSINSDYSVNTFDLTGRFMKREPLLDYLFEFCRYARTFAISEYLLDIHNPLRLLDLWEDDPIGSAGPKVVVSSELTLLQKNQIFEIFTPFSDIIYPQHISKYFSVKDIKAIKRHYASNKLFADELNKRKKRSKAIGEDFNKAQYQEIVWVDYTIKLRNWALENGFDSFVYSNNKEGNGEDTYVVFRSDQFTHSGNSLAFDEEKYLAEMPELIKGMINNMESKIPLAANHVLWAQRDPMPFWK